MKEVKIYAEILEQEALDQFTSAMEQPFSVKGALMPDAHAGYSLPIGAVVATEGVIVPAWVGYDIGCGMCAVRTSFNIDNIHLFSKEIFDEIYKNIPVGFSINQEDTSTYLSTDLFTEESKKIAEFKNFKRALGTLGGGNHFIEIGYDEDNLVWIIIHSGSRGVGHGIATHYMKLASPTGKASEGHYGLDVTSKNGKDYIQDMNVCLDFALQNRKEMINRVIASISKFVYGGQIGEIINRNHNHASLREGLWIHRKGATHAEKGMLGVIPGNMRDGSFIVRGKGNPDSLYSSSHGAGRVLGRKVAKTTLDIEEFRNEMNGITAKVLESTLDESPMAYKNIFEVMNQQKDLVEVLHHVRPLINIKG